MKRIIISGGGTGGHIFPAISIANTIKELEPGAEILFVGAKGRMEMEKVPAAGYEIVGLDIQGLQRSLSPKNLLFPFKVIRSLMQAFKVLKEFKPEVAVGVGGYASGPLLFAAALKGIPILIQEQNSYAGITNKIVGKWAKKICVAFDGMEQFFPAKSILVTGNPVRKDIKEFKNDKEKGLAHFGLKADRPVILILGGSLGARTLNESILAHLDALKATGVQVLWQCGRLYYPSLKEKIGPNAAAEGIHLMEFITDMNSAYAAADVIVSRAGAGTISELCLIKKPVILVPSPNVAEDHQTKNAMKLVGRMAALLVKDTIARTELVPVAMQLLNEPEKQELLKQNLSKLGMPNASLTIAAEVLKLAKQKN